MAPASLRLTLVLSLLTMLCGVACAATALPWLGGVLVLSGWAAATGALHALGRAPQR